MSARQPPQTANGVEPESPEQTLRALARVLAQAAARHWLRENSAVDPIADHLLVCDKSVRRWIQNGDLVAHRIGRQWRIAAADLETFLKLRRMEKR